MCGQLSESLRALFAFDMDSYQRLASEGRSKIFLYLSSARELPRHGQQVSASTPHSVVPTLALEIACLMGAATFSVLTEGAPRRTGDIDGTHLDIEVGQILRGYSFKGIRSSIRGRCYQEFNFSGLVTPRIIPLGSAAGVACQLRIGSLSFIHEVSKADTTPR